MPAWQSQGNNKMPKMEFMSWLRTAVALLVTGLAMAAPASAALSDDDNACLGCHGQEGLSKTFGKDESLPLHVNGAAFGASVHAPLGCAACHSDVDLKTHPAAGKVFDSVRAYSVARAE